MHRNGRCWRSFKSLGANVQPVIFPDSVLYPNNLIGMILNAESAAAFDELTRTNRDDLIERQDKDFWPNSFRSARMIPAVEYINANRYRYDLCKNMYDFMKNYDVLIVPLLEGINCRSQILPAILFVLCRSGLIKTEAR